MKRFFYRRIFSTETKPPADNQFKKFSGERKPQFRIGPSAGAMSGSKHLNVPFQQFIKRRPGGSVRLSGKMHSSGNSKDLFPARNAGGGVTDIDHAGM